MDARLPGRLRPCPSPGEVLNMIDEQCQGHDQLMNFGSFSCSLYDTAWLSLIPAESKSNGFLFPQCLEIILRSQQADGTWPSYASPTDGILTSLAAMLSIATHAARQDLSPKERQKLLDRLLRGTSGVHHLLFSWNIDNAVHVGFEVLVTSLLRQLENHKVAIDFPKRAKLIKLYQSKIAKLTPASVYGTKQTTFLHSIEAFADVIQFEHIAHHCTEEYGIFGSPAATAAYLIHAPQWDFRAETYLRKTLKKYGDTGNVPSAFPTPLFEISWAISSIFSPVIEKSSLGRVEHLKTAHTMSQILDRQCGLVGFAPGILEDADDTARNLLMQLRLAQHGHTFTANVAPMVDVFETDECFKTYDKERNPSFSANCNVVLALLELDNEAIARYIPQIQNALLFLLDLSDTAGRRITDKWNLSSEYSSMLLTEVVVLALHKYDAGNLVGIEQDIFLTRIPVCICRVLNSILRTQEPDGSWKNSLEVTSYAVLTLSQASQLPWIPSISMHLADCRSKAQEFIQRMYPRATPCEYLWIEKTTFQSSLLSIAYCSMAIHTANPVVQWSTSVVGIFDGQSSRMKKLFSMLPLTEKLSSFLLDLALVEAKLHAKVLAADRDSILARGQLSLSSDRYIAYIPAIWLLCNQINDGVLTGSILRDMIRHSQLTFQIDEFMETAIAQLPSADTALLKDYICDECLSSLTSTEKSAQVAGLDAGALSSVKIQLRRFIHYVLHHDVVQRSPQMHQRLLATELADYLLAHMRQNGDNERLKDNTYDEASRLNPTYFTWARTTGADHTSCPFSFRFFMCFVAQSTPQSFLEDAQIQYLASSVAHHLATMCRQYNDYGSLARDAKESNLNSVNFAEFQKPKQNPSNSCNGSSSPSLSAKSDLIYIAEFERQLMDLSFKVLAKELPESAVSALKVLIDVTDMFGQLYIIKDIASEKYR